MQRYDIAVIGAGPAGMMAGIRAGQLKKHAVLIERYHSLGRKVLLSGKGRCNITNTIPLDECIVRFGRQGAFLRGAFSRFYSQDLIAFFAAKGLRLKIERQGRVFPETDNAASVLKVMGQYLREYCVSILYNKRVLAVEKENSMFKIFIEKSGCVQAKKVIVASGGKSFGFTGSTGDGFAIAKKLGHTIVPLKPGLVPLKAKELWVKDLKGLALKNIRLTFKSKAKKIVSDIGELHFTPFGISGALILDLSSLVLGLLEKGKEVFLYIDLKPGLTAKQLEEKFLREFSLRGNENIHAIFKDVLPLALIPVFFNVLQVSPHKKANQISRKERHNIIQLLKAFPLEVVGSLPIEEAMVTCGGISTKEIDPRTMESKIVPGLYFAGEIIDATASSGGYNLQQAFSTGYLAGESAAVAMNKT